MQPGRLRLAHRCGSGLTLVQVATQLDVTVTTAQDCVQCVRQKYRAACRHDPTKLPVRMHAEPDGLLYPCTGLVHSMRHRCAGHKCTRHIYICVLAGRMPAPRRHPDAIGPRSSSLWRGRASTEKSAKEGALARSLPLLGSASAALSLRDPAHHLVAMLAATGPGHLLARPALRSVAHLHLLRGRRSIADRDHCSS